MDAAGLDDRSTSLGSRRQRWPQECFHDESGSSLGRSVGRVVVMVEVVTDNFDCAWWRNYAD